MALSHYFCAEVPRVADARDPQHCYAAAGVLVGRELAPSGRAFLRLRISSLKN